MQILLKTLLIPKQ